MGEYSKGDLQLIRQLIGAVEAYIAKNGIELPDTYAAAYISSNMFKDHKLGPKADLNKFVEQNIDNYLP